MPEFRIIQETPEPLPHSALICSRITSGSSLACCCQLECNNDHINAPPATTFAFVAIYRNNFFAASRPAIRLNSAVSIWIRWNYFEACQFSLWVENSTGFPQLYTSHFCDNDVNTNTSPGGWLGTAIANGRAIMIESTTTANGLLVETFTIHNNMLHTDTGGISVMDVWAHSNPNVSVTLDVMLNSLWGGTQGAIYSDCPTCYVAGRDNDQRRLSVKLERLSE